MSSMVNGFGMHSVAAAGSSRQISFSGLHLQPLTNQPATTITRVDLAKYWVAK